MQFAFEESMNYKPLKNVGLPILSGPFVLLLHYMFSSHVSKRFKIIMAFDF
jgi:hypothetical protein